MNHFCNLLKRKVNSKLLIQQLPKHMRRRAMAHNFYRAPFRLRQAVLQEMKGCETPEDLKRFKFKRHRGNHIKNGADRIESKKYKWMETHLWHAKRFKIANLEWADGLRIPLRCNDKSLRSIYKLCKNESTALMDISYHKHCFITDLERVNNSD